MKNNVTILPEAALTPMAWRPHQLHGWPFLKFEEGDIESAPIKGLACTSGPTIVFNPIWCPKWLLEDPTGIRLWLVPSLIHICQIVLHESVSADDGVGRFASASWDAFRSEVSKLTLMTWSEILEAAAGEREDYVAEHLVQCLLIESGFLDRVMVAQPHLA